MKKLFLSAIVGAAGLFMAGSSHAYVCDNVDSYVAGTTYGAGQVVQNGGNAFQCDVGGWCSSGSDAYEPGVGWASGHAWTDLGVCETGGSSSGGTSSGGTSSGGTSSGGTSSGGTSSGGTSSGGTSSGGGVTCTAPVYVVGDQYEANQIVQHNGNDYLCTVAGWCSSAGSAWAYEPGVGAHWSDAWNDLGLCQDHSSGSSSGGTSSGGSSSGGTVPDQKFCASEWVPTKAYAKGSIAGYNNLAYRALVDTHGVTPDSTTWVHWEVAGTVDESLCPVKIPNTIDYGVPQPVDGNPNTGIVHPTGTVSAAKIANTPSTIAGTKGGVDPATDPGGNHPGFDADNGARVAKLAPGKLPLQHNVYQLSAGTETVAYLGDWAIYGRQFDFSKLPASNLDRLVYGFAGICFPGAATVQDPGFPMSAPSAVNRTCKQSKLPDGAMAIADFEAAFLRKLNGAPEPKIVGIESMYEISPSEVSGVFGVLYELRKANPNLHLDLSVGGWTLSEGFPWMASDPARRKAFVDSIVHFLERFEFDGIDIDWEYPGSDGAVPGMSRPDDAETYLQLIKDLRAGMDWLTKKTGKKYRLSSAVPATTGKMDKIDWLNVGKYLDRLYVMTYDLTGAWERNISHHTPLYDNPNANGSSTGASASTAMLYMQNHGVPANKLMIGVANYHRSKAMIPGDITEYTNGLTGNTTFGDPNATGADFILGIAGIGSWEAGVLEGYDMYQNFLDKYLHPKNGYKIYTDKLANADFLVQDTIGSFISIETPRTAALKAQYAKDNGLAGIFFWQIEQDNGYNLNAVQHVLGNTLVTKTSDAVEADQIATCGENVTVAECEALIQSLKK